MAAQHIHGRMLKQKIRKALNSVEFWLYSVGSTVSAYAWIDPMNALLVYNAMPVFVQLLLPKKLLIAVGALLFGTAAITTFAKKKRKKRKKCDGVDNE